ncbi:metal-dependent hydrolase [Laceyella putida]|uniref:Metal-dependent hydrolase n=1 Tax=Laceyella putida TaxID=110101 RepID=A0ABW2RK77_9BACL
MDTLTHGLFGYTMYQCAKKEGASPDSKRALLFMSLVSNQIPDIDVIARLTETGRIMDQMWHRGLTHSILFIPIWATLIYACCRLFFNVKEKRLLYLALFGVALHDFIDCFNAWGTGLFEPFSSARITLGTIPIVDLVFWVLFLVGFILAFVKKNWPKERIYRLVALGMLLHLSLQTAQGLYVEHRAEARYDRVELAASFVPWHFQVIGKKGSQVELSEATAWSSGKPTVTLASREETDLRPLFAQNPKAKVLYEWSPFVVIVNDEGRLGIFDPRFYRNGESFVSEYIEK